MFIHLKYKITRFTIQCVIIYFQALQLPLTRVKTIYLQNNQELRYFWKKIIMHLYLQSNIYNTMIYEYVSIDIKKKLSSDKNYSCLTIYV